MRFRLRTLLIVLALGLYGLAAGLTLLMAAVFAVVSLDENILGILGWLLEVYSVHLGIPLAIILALCGAIIHVASTATRSRPT